MSEPIKDYEDVTVYNLDDDRERALLEAQKECVFMWTTKDGDPVGVIMSYVYRDGRIWLTAARQRKRIAALRRDPRACVCITSTGTRLGPGKTVTYKGTCIVHDDQDDVKAWFYPALEAAINPDRLPGGVTVEFLDSPARVILEFVPGKRIAFDGEKMAAATIEAERRRR